MPAGNLFSTVDDLARFASALLADGGGLAKPETLHEMWRPQLTKDEAGFGLGFIVGKFRGHRTISHNGAVYGYSSLLVLLPEEKLAAVVLGNEDVVNGRIHHMATPLSRCCWKPNSAKSLRCQPSSLRRGTSRFAGDYESQSYRAHLVVRDGRLGGEISGQPTRFVPTGKLSFTAYNRIDDALPAAFEQDATGAISGFKYGLIQHFTRVPAKPRALPPEWARTSGVMDRPSFH